MTIFIAFTCIISCDTEDTLTCLKTTGDTVSENYDVDFFNKVIVYERVQLIVKDSPEISVRLETGENLLEDMEVFVEDGVLTIRNNGACNLFRDYDGTKVYVSAPNLLEIRNSSGFTVLSDGIIGWDTLALISDDLIEEDFYHKDGDFKMELAAENVLIQCNGLSNYFLSGSVENLEIRLLEGDSRLPLKDLIVQHVIVNHTGTNDIIISPLQSITGELRSTGNLILKTTPPLIDIDELFTGRVIFDD